MTEVKWVIIRLNVLTPEKIINFSVKAKGVSWTIFGTWSSSPPTAKSLTWNWQK